MSAFGPSGHLFCAAECPLSGGKGLIDGTIMAKKSGTNPKKEFVFFDVIYEDGSQRSNRRVPAKFARRSRKGRARAWLYHRAGPRDRGEIGPETAVNQEYPPRRREEQIT
jgi:hypothetical protein